jgi:3-phenylpropionate/trans-cinnamate dioxygenase subunit beta
MTNPLPAAASIAAIDCAPGTPLYGEIIEFLYREAELLDSYRYNDWIALFADDIRYVMPVRTTQFLTKGAGFHDVAFYDENLVSLRTRVQRLQTEFAWAETPPSRSRHFVSNVLVEPGERANEFAVRSNFMITRTRSDHGHQMFTGQRADILRRDEATGWKIAQRRILVDQTVITGTNLSVLF